MGSHAAPERPRRRWLGVVAALALTTVMTGTAFAFWTAAGGGTGTAAAGTITAPTVTATATPGSPNVSIAWTAPTVPSGATVTGYYVVRDQSGTPADACGGDPDNLLPDTPRTCVDAAVPNGTYTYTVTAVLSGWEATSIPSAAVTVANDVNAPTMTLAGVSQVNAFLGPNGVNYRLYYRQNAAGGGSFRLAAAITDIGSGPKSATFPAVATTSWTHNAETVLTGTGSAPTITYTSAPWTWLQFAGTPATKTITGTDVDGNTVTRTVTFRRDNSNPAGGALAVNGVTANTSGTNNSTSSTGSFNITTLTQYTETQSTTQSGLAASSLVRDTASLSGGTCGVTYSGAVTITGPAPVAQSGLPTGCYRYRLTGIDNVGNTVTRTTTVRVDTSAPSGGALTVNSVAASPVGTTSLNSTGSWTIAQTSFADAESGTTNTLTEATAVVTNGACGAFGAATTITAVPQTGTARTCYRYVLTGTNAVGLTASLTTTVMVGPFVTGVALNNGIGIAGRASQGDTVVITFSDTMTPSTFCSTWTGSGDKVLNADNQVTASVNQVGGGDTFTVTATGCTFNLGTIALGDTGYTTATATFGGAGAAKSSITWTAATRTLTVTLGATASGALGTVATSAVTYTPSTAIQNSSGVALGGTFGSGTAQRF